MAEDDDPLQCARLNKAIERHRDWLEDKENGKRLSFADVDLRHDEVVLDNKNLSKAQLPKANFAGKDLRRVTFDRAFLASADFTGCSLTDVSFNGARLDGADFTNASLVSVDLTRAHVRGRSSRSCGQGTLHAVTNDIVRREPDGSGPTTPAVRPDNSLWGRAEGRESEIYAFARRKSS